MKKKIGLIAAVLLLLLCSSLATAACGEKYVPPVDIRFDVDCEVDLFPERTDRIKDKEFQPGETIYCDPQTEMGYNLDYCYFDGWYLDSEYTKKFIQSEWEWHSGITLYGIYRKKTYTVTFKVDGETIDTQKVKYGDRATNPQEPEKEGHYLGAWRADEYLNSEGNVVKEEYFSFYNGIYADTLLENTWLKNMYRINVDLEYYEYVRHFEYEDNIKEYLKEIEQKEMEFSPQYIPDGYFYDENYTRPFNPDTYEVTGNDTIYLRTRINYEHIFGLEKQVDGTYGINKLQSYYWNDYEISNLMDSNGIIRIPGEFINKQGEKCIISTIKTGALKQVYDDKGIVVLDKNIKKLESGSLSSEYGWDKMYSARFFFESKESEMEIAEDYIGADSEKNVVAYFGVDYKFNDDFFYQDTGNDIIILHSRQEGGDLIIPEKIDGKPVTRINSAAISNYNNVYLCDKISSIRPHAIRRVTNLYCAFSEGFGTDVLPSEWRDSYGTVHYNSPYPPQL